MAAGEYPTCGRKLFAHEAGAVERVVIECILRAGHHHATVRKASLADIIAGKAEHGGVVTEPGTPHVARVEW